MALSLSIGAPRVLLADPSKAPSGAASTSTTSSSLDEVELARYLDVLEEMDLLENLEVLKLLPALEDDQ